MTGSQSSIVTKLHYITLLLFKMDQIITIINTPRHFEANFYSRPYYSEKNLINEIKPIIKELMK